MKLQIAITRVMPALALTFVLAGCSGDRAQGDPPREVEEGVLQGDTTSAPLLDSPAREAEPGGPAPASSSTSTPTRTAPPPATATPPSAPPETREEPREEPPPTPDPVQVNMRDIAFQPSRVEIAAGTTVTWTNHDQVQHTVTAADGSWDSGPIDPGGSFRRTFNSAGTYRYACTPHPPMTGTVVVKSGS